MGALAGGARRKRVAAAVFAALHFCTRAFAATRIDARTARLSLRPASTPDPSHPPRGHTAMKLYYHPISTTSRTIMLFAAESGIPLEMQVVDLFTGEHVQPPYAALNPNRLVPDARGRRLRPDRELGDPQVPGRQDRLAGLPEGPAAARARQRAHGLDQHAAVQRPGLRPGLPADLRHATSAAATRRRPPRSSAPRSARRPG